MAIWLFNRRLNRLGYAFGGGSTAPACVGVSCDGVCDGSFNHSVHTCILWCRWYATFLIGVNSGLENKDDLAQALANIGMDLPAYIFNISGNVGMIHGMVGFFNSVNIVRIFDTIFWSKTLIYRRSKSGALCDFFAGLAFTIPYALTAKFIGPELPSIVGAVVGLSLVIPAAKRGF